MCVPSYLSHLLDKTPEQVYYNDEDYQKDGFNINTCGRHCCYYILNMLHHSRYVPAGVSQAHHCPKKKIQDDV